MKSQKKQTKLLFGFALSMMDKAIEMQQAKNEFQDLKNEELRLKSNTPSVEQIFPLGGEFVVPTRFKNKEKEEKIDEIMKNKRFPSGGILVGIGKKRPNGEKDDCDCPACVLRRTFEGKERGFND